MLLSKKTALGKWVDGSASIDSDGYLTWREGAGGGGEFLTLKLDKSTRCTHLGLGLRKHAFEVACGPGGGEVSQFAAKSGLERGEWINSVCKAAGISPAEGCSSGGAGTENDKNKENNPCVGAQRSPKNVRVAGLANLLAGLPGGGNLGGGLLPPGQAQQRLKDKLAGKVRVDRVSDESCVVCHYKVDDSERVVLGPSAGDGIVHHTCLYCTSCGVTLRPEALARCARGKLFCVDHVPDAAGGPATRTPGPAQAQALADRGQQQRQQTARSSLRQAAGGASATTTAAPAAATTHQRSASDIDNSALLSRPTLKGRRARRKPTRAGAAARRPAVSAMSDADKAEHFSAFLVAPVGGGNTVTSSLACYTGSVADKRKWCDTISNAIELARLNAVLESAQRVDMLSAIQAQMDIESFEKTHQVEHSGKLQTAVRKKPKDVAKFQDAFVRLQQLELAAFDSAADAQTGKKPLFSARLFAAAGDCGIKLVDATSNKQITFNAAKPGPLAAEQPSQPPGGGPPPPPPPPPPLPQAQNLTSVVTPPAVPSRHSASNVMELPNAPQAFEQTEPDPPHPPAAAQADCLADGTVPATPPGPAVLHQPKVAGHPPTKAANTTKTAQLLADVVAASSGRSVGAPALPPPVTSLPPPIAPPPLPPSGTPDSLSTSDDAMKTVFATDAGLVLRGAHRDSEQQPADSVELAPLARDTNDCCTIA